MRIKFLCPSDQIKLTEPGALTKTLQLLEGKALDETQDFLKSISALPKGTQLEVSQLHIKNAKKSEHFVSFKVLGGSLHSKYNKYLTEKELLFLESKIKELRQSLDLAIKNNEKVELSYSLKKREKRFKDLKKRQKKTGVTKLFIIHIEDIESWNMSSL